MIEIINLYQHIPPDDRDQFVHSVITFEKKKGDFLLFDGDVQGDLFMIKSGVACLFDDSGRNRRIIDFFYHNRFCADFISFTNQIPSTYCIKCLSDSQIECISYEHLSEVLDQSRAIERAYRILLENLLIAALKQNESLKALDMEGRFKRIMHHKPELFKLVSHKYIASYINIDVTNFSKLYNKYCVKNGLLYG